MPTAMAVSGGRVFIQNEKALVALDAATGNELWQAARPVNLDAPGSSAPTLVASGGVVICADREVGTASRDKDDEGRSASWHLFPHTAHSRGGEAIAYDAATGKRLVERDVRGEFPGAGRRVRDAITWHSSDPTNRAWAPEST